MSEEYITKSSVFKLLSNKALQEESPTTIITCLRLSVNMLESKDVKPVRKGKWFWDERGCTCTVCNRTSAEESTYCPKCGAEMEIEK